MTLVDGGVPWKTATDVDSAATNILPWVSAQQMAAHRAAWLVDPCVGGTVSRDPTVGHMIGCWAVDLEADDAAAERGRDAGFVMAAAGSPVS